MEQQIRQIIRTILLQELGHISNDSKFFTEEERRSNRISKSVRNKDVGYGLSKNLDYMTPLAKILKAVVQKTGIKPVKFLGKGSFGFAFLTADGKTMKLTKDQHEVQMAFKILKLNSIHFPKIYDVFKLKLDNMFDGFVIIKDYVFHNEKYTDSINSLRKQFRNVAEQFRIEYSANMPSDISGLIALIQGGFYSRNDENIQKFFKFLNENNYKNLLWFVKETIDIAHELHSLGVKELDFNGNNIGIKNKHLVYFDAPDYSDQFQDDIENMPYDLKLAESDKGS